MPRLKREVQSQVDERKAKAQRDTAEAVLFGVQAAVLGGTLIGTAAWTALRMNRTLTHENLVRGGSGLVLHPGIKAWIADEVGLIVGPLLATQLPKGLSDAGLNLAGGWVAHRWDEGTMPSTEIEAVDEGDPGRSVASITALIRGGDWYDAVWEGAEPKGEQRRYRFMGMKLAPSVVAMITLVMATGAGALVTLVTKGAEKLADKVVP